MLRWTAKEYMMFTGTDGFSFVTGHAFTVLKAVVLDIAGTPTKMVQMRNPWKKHDGGWTGDYSETKGGATWTNLVKALEASGGLKVEAGKFWMCYTDFLKHYANLVISFSQESMTAGGPERVEYRPLLKLSPDAKQYVRMTLFEDADLDNYFGL